MTNPVQSLATASVDRRSVLKTLAAMGVGAATACRPVPWVLRLPPGGFDGDPQQVDRVLRAFVTTVVPGISQENPSLVRFFYDDYYPLVQYRDYLASDLCSASAELLGTAAFDRLSLHRRTEVIRKRLELGGVTRRVYRGAIYLSQISCYAGIYDDDSGCLLIDFPGRYRAASVSASSYPDPYCFLPRATSADGNPS